MFGHRTDCLPDYPGSGSPPACMDCRDNHFSPVTEQNGDAIGNLDTYQYPPLYGYNSIGDYRTSSGVEDKYCISMFLHREIDGFFADRHNTAYFPDIRAK
jgi:hypothetical protein